MATVHQIVATDKAPPALGPYSQAIIANGFVFCSGSIGMNPSTKQVPEGVADQTNQVFDNLAAILQQAGSSFSKVVKTTVFLQNMDDFATVNKVYQERMGGALPARACVEVARLPMNVLVEIECTATVN